MQLIINHHTIAYHDGFESLSHQFDAFLVDIWGVLHDSAKPYLGAVDCLKHFRSANKQVILLSNAGRRASVLAKELLAFGIDNQLYDHIVSSGELAWNAFSSSQNKQLKKLGTKFYLLGPERYALTEGLALQQVHHPDEADFVLTVGVFGNPSSVDPQVPILQKSLDNQLTMVCANPDLQVVRDGVMGIAAGALAKRYEEMGGTVIYFGKPHQITYQVCFDHLQITDKSKILAVGDALNTDIAGANKFGIAGALVGTGIHATELSELPKKTAASSNLFSKFQEYPTMIIPAFCW